MARRSRVAVTGVNDEVVATPPAVPALVVTSTAPTVAVTSPAAVYIASLGVGSRRTMWGALENLAVLTGAGFAAETLPWWLLRYEHTTALRSLLLDRVDAGELAVATANKHLSALRGVLREAWRLELMTAEDYQRTADIENITGETLLAGRSIGKGELQALFRVCMDDLRPAGCRDAAIAACLYAGGLRRSEVVTLDFDDYEPDSGRIRIRLAKGRKQRDVWITGGGRDALTDWSAVRGSWTGPLFVAINKGGTLGTRALTSAAILRIIERRARAAGVKDFSPHDLRRSFVGDLLDAGADLVTVQRMAGHAQPSTTARYDRRGDRVKQKAGELLHVPYRRRSD